MSRRASAGSPNAPLGTRVTMCRGTLLLVFDGFAGVRRVSSGSSIWRGVKNARGLPVWSGSLRLYESSGVNNTPIACLQLVTHLQRVHASDRGNFFTRRVCIQADSGESPPVHVQLIFVLYFPAGLYIYAPKLCPWIPAKQGSRGCSRPTLGGMTNTFGFSPKGRRTATRGSPCPEQKGGWGKVVEYRVRVLLQRNRVTARG